MEMHDLFHQVFLFLVDIDKWVSNIR